MKLTIIQLATLAERTLSEEIIDALAGQLASAVASSAQFLSKEEIDTLLGKSPDKWEIMRRDKTLVSITDDGVETLRGTETERLRERRLVRERKRALGQEYREKQAQLRENFKYKVEGQND